MQIHKKYVLQFQQLYEKTYNEKLSYDESYSQLKSLINLCKIIYYKPLTKEERSELRKMEGIKKHLVRCKND